MSSNLLTILGAQSKFISLAILTSLLCLVAGILFGLDPSGRVSFRLRESVASLLFPQEAEFIAPFEFSYLQTQKLIATRPHEALFPLQKLWFCDFKDNLRGAQVLVRQQKQRKILVEYCLAVHEPDRAKFAQLAPFFVVYNHFCSVNRDLGALPTYQQYLQIPWVATHYRDCPKSFEFRIGRGPLIDVYDTHPLYTHFEKAFGTDTGSSGKRVKSVKTEIVDKLYLTQLDDDPFRDEILRFQF